MIICTFGVIADTENLPPQEKPIQQDEDDKIDDVAVIIPPYLVPEPQTEVTIDAGSAFRLYIGQPTSEYDNSVEVEINVGRAFFVQFDD